MLLNRDRQLVEMRLRVLDVGLRAQGLGKGIVWGFGVHGLRVRISSLSLSVYIGSSRGQIAKDTKGGELKMKQYEWSARHTKPATLNPKP